MRARNSKKLAEYAIAGWYIPLQPVRCNSMVEHGNMPWADHRCVLIAFTVNVNGHSALDRAHAEHLVDAGYRLPERTFNSAFGSAAPGQLQLDKFFR